MKKPIITFCLCLLAVGIATAQQMPLCLGDNYYQKRMVKVFEALNENKLDKAAKYWQEIEEKAAKDDDINRLTPISQQLYPVWQLSECVMMNTREGHGKLTEIVPYSPWGAYKQLKKIYASTLDVEIANRFLSHKDLKMNIEEIKTSIEKNLVDTVRKINTEEAYDQMLELLFDYNDLSTVENERELIAYNNTKHTQTLADCQRYLDKYGQLNPTHHFTIEWRRDSLAFEGLGKTAAACKNYLESYPSSQFNPTVQQMLHRYAFEELDATVEACQEYIRLYPESEFNDSVKSLEADYAFRDAKVRNAIGSYAAFIKNYPEAPHIEQAKQLLQQSVNRRYFNARVTIDELRRFHHSSEDLQGVDRSRITTLMRNLLFLPTSALMNGCDGLLGKVAVSSDPNKLENEDIKIFNDQGLMVRHYDSSSRLDDRFQYGFDPEKGFMLLSKTEASGRVVTYETKWNELGDIIEVAGSDGSIIGFTWDYDYMKKVIYYNGRTAIRTDYYDNDYRIDKSVRSGNVTINYRYNSEGDPIGIYRKKGKSVTDSTTFEYGYAASTGLGQPWQWRNRFDNGKMQSTRYRQFNKTIDRLQCDSQDTYLVDWFSEIQEADTAHVVALVKELDNYLNEKRAAAERYAQMSPSSSVHIIEQTPQEAMVSPQTVTPTVVSNPLPEEPAEPEQPAQQEPEKAIEPVVASRIDDDGAHDPISRLIKDMVLVEGGTFTMGATAEQDDDAWEQELPAHQVKLSSFYICKYEVTQELWTLIMGENPSAFADPSHPVEMVSWDDCQKFITKLNKKTGLQFRLPTEAEWEYAARGGNKKHDFKYAGNNELDGIAWYNRNAEQTSHPVGFKQPNELGLFDMSGNVMEWCEDWYNYYSEEFQTNPIGKYESMGRIQRGGSWNQTDNLCRVSFRGVCTPTQRTNDTGLRLVASSLK